MRSFLSCLLCAVSLTSCMQELCQWSAMSSSSTTRFEVDWGESNIATSQINNVSVYGFPSDGGAPYLRVSGDIGSTYLNLPQGEYSLLLLSDFVGDIAGVSFEDVEVYDNFRAQVIEREVPSNLYCTLAQDEVLASTIEQIAAWREDEYVVTADMVSCSYCGEAHAHEVVIEVEPTPITTQCLFTLSVENLDNAQIIQGVVRGFASGAYLSTGERLASEEQSEVVYSVIFTSRSYFSDSSTDGEVTAEITTFGKSVDTDQSYELEIDVILNSGELAIYKRDITDQVQSQDNITIYITLDSSDDLISLPESDGTGFGVEGWGDKESIELM